MALFVGTHIGGIFIDLAGHGSRAETCHMVMQTRFRHCVFILQRHEAPAANTRLAAGPREDLHPRAYTFATCAGRSPTHRRRNQVVAAAAIY
jgi:hypothetical protein